MGGEKGHYVYSEKRIKHYVHPNYLHKVFLLLTKFNLNVWTPERANQKQNPTISGFNASIFAITVLCKFQADQ